MFTGEDSNSPRQLSARNSQYLDQMALWQVGKKRNLPSDHSPIVTTQISLTGQPTYDLHCPNMAQQTGLGGEILKPQLPPCYSRIQFNDSHCLNTTQQIGLEGGLLKPQSPPYYSGIPTAKSDLPCGFGVSNNPVDLPPQKRFLIFDHSDDRMRLYFGSSLLPPLDQTITSKTPADGDSKIVEAQMDRPFLVNEEKWDENHLTDEESEMREDTEEINALLYSDSYDGDDYGSDDDDDDDDEVTSPISDPSLSKDKVRNEEYFIEKVGSSYNSRKRQRLLDGNYKPSSFETAGTPMKRWATSHSSESDVESKCFHAKSAHNDNADSLNREKEAKIRKTLLVLTSMIPGLKNKNPLSIFDNYIFHLESMKAEAEALGLGTLESELPSYP